MLGGILYYNTRGHNRPCGQAIGANGAGSFAIMINGTADEAEDAAYRFIRKLEKDGHQLMTAEFIRNDKFGHTFCGNPVKSVDAKDV